jgi:hypothetical protein
LRTRDSGRHYRQIRHAAEHQRRYQAHESKKRRQAIPADDVRQKVQWSIPPTAVRVPHPGYSP